MGGPGRLPRSAPAAEGVSAAGILAFLDAVERRRLQLHSLMVLRHGAVIAEGWWRPYQADLPHQLYSLSKSVTATAVGCAVAEGRLSVDDPVVGFFPGELPAAVGPNLAAMRIRHLLTMTSGHDQDTTGRIHQQGPSWVRAFLALDVEHAPGSHFVYNSGATYMLSAIVQRVTSQPLVEYLAPRLFGPLGILGPTWESCPLGINVGGWGLSLTTEDIARFGLLYLRGGRWGDRQIVPAEWVAAATAKQVPNGDGGASDWAQGYGYQFWRCRHGLYRGDGAHGQFCVVLPAHDAVVAITGGTDALQAVLDCVWDHVLPAMDGPGAPSGDSALAERLAGLSVGPVDVLDGPPPGWADRTYRLEGNAAGLESVGLVWDAGGCTLTLVEGGVTQRIQAGLGHWLAATAAAGGAPAPCAGRVAWSEEGELRLDWAFTTTPFVRTLRIRPAGAGHQLEYRTNVGRHAGGLTIRGT